MMEGKSVQTYTSEDIVKILSMIKWQDVFVDKEVTDFVDVVRLFYQLGTKHGASKDLIKMALHELVNIGCKD